MIKLNYTASNLKFFALFLLLSLNLFGFRGVRLCAAEISCQKKISFELLKKDFVEDQPASADWQRLSEKSFEVFLIHSLVHTWLYGEKDFQLLLDRLTLSSLKKESALFFVRAALLKKYSANLVLERILPQVNSSEAGKISFLSPESLAWLRVWLADKEDKKNSKKPSGLALYIYAIYSWEEKRFDDYFSAMEKFVSYLKAKDFYPVIQGEGENILQPRFAATFWAHIYMLTRLGQTYARALDPEIKFPAMTKLDPTLGKVAKKFGPEFEKIFGCLKFCQTQEDKAGVLKGYFKKWQIQMNELGFHRGRLVLRGKSNLDLLYNIGRERQESVLLVSGKTVLVANNGSLYWPDPEVQSRVFRVSRTLSHDLNPRSLFIGLSFKFDKKDNRYTADFNFSLDDSPRMLLDWSSLWNLLLESNFIADESSPGQYHILRFNARDPFISNRLLLKIKNGTLESMLISSIQKHTSFALRDLVFGKIQGTIFPFKYIFEKTPKPRMYREVEFGLEKIFLNRILFNRVMQSMTKSAASDMAALAQGKKINNMLKEDFLKKKEQTLAENLILAKKYEAMAESNFNYPELWAISGNLYLEGYEFNSAARSFEKYFNIQREVDLEDKGLSVQLPAILHAEKLYINALIQNREYEKAELYLDKKLQEESLMSEESFSDKISFGITLSDIASRKGNWEKALKRFTELEKFITLHMNNYPLSQGTLAVILRARTLQIQVLAYLKKFEEARHKLDQLMELYNKKPLATRFSVKLFLENISFPKNWPLPKEESVRLAHIPSLTGQGKNYCVPIAVQFILRYFGDNAANQRQIAEEMGTTEQGTNFIQMIAYLKKKGFQVKAFIGTRERVGLFLKNSIPMLTLFYPKNADIGHIASLIGMDAQSGVYYFYEPAETSAVKAMSAEELSRLQIAVGNIFLAFVPQGRDFPREVNGSDSRQDEIALLILNYIDQMTLQRWEKEPREILDTIAKLDTDNKFQKFISFQKALLLLNKFYGNEIGEAELASTKKLLTDVDSFRVENGDSFHEYMRILGQLAYFVKDFARSRQAFMNAIALNPLDIQSIYMLAELLAREGQFQAAGVFYRKALAKLPYFHSVIPNLRNEILLKLAGIYKKEGKTGEMIQYLIYAANLTDLKNKLTLYTLEAMREHKSSNTLDFIRTFVESEK